MVSTQTQVYIGIGTFNTRHLKRYAVHIITGEEFDASFQVPLSDVVNLIITYAAARPVKIMPYTNREDVKPLCECRLEVIRRELSQAGLDISNDLLQTSTKT